MLHRRPSTTLLLLVQLLALAALTRAARIEDLPEEPSPANNSSSLVWQPLRATFRPLNRAPVSLAPPPPPPEPAADLAEPTTPTPTPPPAAAAAVDEEELPTRVPLSRFRPTRPPSVDAQAQPARPPAASGSHLSAGSNANQTGPLAGGSYRISQDCFECICEASTGCNPRSRCQTSDVRHTRCGLFLISYDQWLESGLSRQLVTREALARDPAADERAFYDCVTERECAERLLVQYMARRAHDCDKDGRLDCYDVAAVHQGGPDQCQAEPLLDSQYWTDFNACLGFGRR